MSREINTVMQEFSSEYLRKKALDRWENEGGSIILNAPHTSKGGADTNESGMRSLASLPDHQLRLGRVDERSDIKD
jgi:hypothetical protein